MNNFNLDPCPFCGKSNYNIRVFQKCVECANCGAMGPKDDDIKEFILKWNERADIEKNSISKIE